MTHADISVVIGFRNWGAQRIKRSAQSILNSFGPYRGEIIISDYGSDDSSAVKAVAEELGLKYIFTAEAPVWSRSKALNAGFSIAEGDVLVSTDADMLFTPSSFEIIYETIRSQPNSALFLQCRDLPSEMSAEALETRDKITWEQLEAAGRLRPRWGMGGMMAISREGMNAIRGFDERLHTYGGEDRDFAFRARRAGYKTVWIDDPRVRMYHMWHPSSLAIADQTEEGRKAFKFNQEVRLKDTTTFRNVMHWEHPLADSTPLVTVALATYNRANLLKETIQSVLMQSMKSFELIILDDGSTDNTLEVVKSFNDSRIKYIYQEQSGISSARNHILREANGHFTAVIDSDDLMHPRRLEWQLEALTEGVDGTVGSFINFDDTTGAYKVYYSQNPSIHQLSQSSATPGHGTWLVRTSILKNIKYNEGLTSGVDHEIFLRMVRTGVNFQHIGKPLLLRRVHQEQITVAEPSHQEEAAKRSWNFFMFSINTESRKYLNETMPATFYVQKDPVNTPETILPYLPDHIVQRTSIIDVTGNNIKDVQNLVTDGEKQILSLTAPEKKNNTKLLIIENASYSDLVKIAKFGKNLRSWISGINSNLKKETSSYLPGLVDATLPQIDYDTQNSYAPLQVLIKKYSDMYNIDTGISILSTNSLEDYQNLCNEFSETPVKALGLHAGEICLYALPCSFDLSTIKIPDSVHRYLELGYTGKEN